MTPQPIRRFSIEHIKNTRYMARYELKVSGTFFATIYVERAIFDGEPAPFLDVELHIPDKYSTPPPELTQHLSPEAIASLELARVTGAAERAAQLVQMVENTPRPKPDPVPSPTFLNGGVTHAPAYDPHQGSAASDPSISELLDKALASPEVRRKRGRPSKADLAAREALAHEVAKRPNLKKLAREFAAEVEAMGGIVIAPEVAQPKITATAKNAKARAAQEAEATDAARPHFERLPDKSVPRRPGRPKVPSTATCTCGHNYDDHPAAAGFVCDHAYDIDGACGCVSYIYAG